MELNRANSTANTGGILESRKYTFEASGEMFDSVFKNLYSRPISSIVREIYTNAMEVSTPDNPPEVTVPSLINPTFSVRDYGPGISKDDIFNIYSVAGASTKRTSNDYVGAFGLGAKSPFSYADSFSVTSRHGGTRNSYLIFRDKERIPTISLVSSVACSPSDTGLEVSLGVNLADIESWQTAIQKELANMPILPRLKNSTILLIPPPLLNTRGNVSTFKSGAYQFTNVLCMGGPCYPIQLTGEYRDITNLFIQAPIGAVDLTPSRESLQYTPRTLRYLDTTIKAYLTTLKDEVSVAFKDATTIFEARKIYCSLTDHSSPVSSTTAIIRSLPSSLVRKVVPFRWNNFDITHPSLPCRDLLPLALLNLNLQYQLPRKKGPFELKYMYVSLDEPTTIYIHTPLDTKWEARLRQNKIPYQQGRNSTPVWKVDWPLNIIDEVAKACNINFIPISSLPYTKPTPVRRSSRKAITSNLVGFDKVGGGGMRMASAGGYYVYKFRNALYLPSCNITKANYRTATTFNMYFLRRLDQDLKFGIIEDYLVAVPPSEYKLFDRVLKEFGSIWTPAEELIDKYCTAALTKLNGNNVTAAYNTYTELSSVLPWASRLPQKYQPLVDEMKDILSAVSKVLPPASSQTLPKSGLAASDITTFLTDYGLPIPKLPSVSPPPEIKEMEDFYARPDVITLLRFTYLCRSVLNGYAPDTSLQEFYSLI